MNDSRHRCANPVACDYCAAEAAGHRHDQARRRVRNVRAARRRARAARRGRGRAA